MRVLIGCESSGTVRNAFRALGHDAWSCDVLPADDLSEFHLTGDLLTFLGDGWDIMIAHPPCTYLTVSAAWAFGPGPYHQQVKPGTLVGEARRAAREDALAFVRALMNAPIARVALENPVGAISSRIRPADQYIQPFQFGDDASKRTGLWLKGLRPLRIDPSARVAGRVVGTDARGHPVERWANQTDGGQNRLPPGADRWKARSKTYSGIARAMAAQWGCGDLP